jgi:di/tricarboxylate transporter
MHALGVIVLGAVVAIGTWRPINPGILALVATFLVGTLGFGETVRDTYAGFPVDLLILLVGVTYLFGVAVQNGTVAHIVDRSVGRARRKPALLPWIVFALAAAPAMAGALGSTGVALLAPLAMRVAERCALDRRMIGLMVVHGAAAGNFSPLNVLGALVHQSLGTRGISISPWTLFAANLAANLLLAVVIVLIFRGHRPSAAAPAAIEPGPGEADRALSFDQVATLLVMAAVATGAFVFGLSIGYLALTAAVLLQLAFPSSSTGAERHVAWGVVLLVCGIVTYVAALQRYGTVTAAGTGIAALASPLIVALLLCGVGALTSAFASSAAIIGAMIPLAAPLMAQGAVDPTGLAIALALSATLVDAAPFSTVGALVVANASDAERVHVYRGLLAWGGAMVIVAPLVTWLVFIVPKA